MATADPVSMLPRPTIGFVGAGRVGEPIVERLLAAGYTVLLSARRPEVVDRLVGQGALPVREVTDLAAADIVISCLYDDEQVRAVLRDTLAPALQPGTVLVSHTTGTPHAVTEVADAAAGRGAFVVEAPFSGNAAGVREARLTVLLGGPPGVLDTVEPVLRAYADPVVRTGGPGSALRVKLLNNVVFAACAQLTLHAVQAGRQMGVDEDALLAALEVSSGASAAARYVREHGGSAAFAAQVVPFLHKDVEAALLAAEELGVDLGPLLAAARTGPIHLA